MIPHHYTSHHDATLHHGSCAADAALYAPPTLGALFLSGPASSVGSCNGSRPSHLHDANRLDPPRQRAPPRGAHRPTAFIVPSSVGGGGYSSSGNVGPSPAERAPPSFLGSANHVHAHVHAHVHNTAFIPMMLRAAIGFNALGFMEDSQMKVWQNNLYQMHKSHDQSMVDSNAFLQTGSPRGPPEEFATAALEWIEEVQDRVRKAVGGSCGV